MVEALMRSGHVVIDGDGVLLSIDRGFCSLMRLEIGALVGRPVLDITAPADRIECGQAIAKLRTTRTPFEVAKRFIRDDGSLVWATSSVSMVGNGRDSDVMIATINPIVESDEPRAPARLLDCARMITDIAADRGGVFDRALFSDTAWDAMLAAYIAEAEGRAISVGGLAYKLDIPLARAERWVNVLIGHGVIEIETREPDAYAPKSFRLTGPAHGKLEEHLARAGERVRGATFSHSLA
jgi:PAS domain S-box-containing protein